MKKIIIITILAIPLLLSGQKTLIFEVDSTPRNFKFKRYGNLYNLSYDMCIESCPDSLLRYQPCKYSLFNNANDRAATSTGVEYTIPFHKIESMRNKDGIDYQNESGILIINFHDRNVENDSISTFTIRLAPREHQTEVGEYTLEISRIIQGSYQYYTPQNYMFNED